jgi:hypothetical protein
MRKRFLSLVAVAAMTLTAMAQTWTAPVQPTSPAQGVDYEADGSTAYYLYNVGAGQFVLGANNWATQISLSADSKPYMEIVVEELDGTDAENFPDCVKIKLNGTFYFSGGNNRTDYEVSNTYLFRDSEASGFIDHNNQAVWFWKFTKANSGNYYWQSAPGMGSNKFPNSETQYAKSGGPGNAVEFNGAIDAANNEWAFVPVGSVTAESMASFSAAMELYTARLDLYDLLNDAVLYGVDYAAASAVYNNTDASAADITAAAEALRPDVNAAAIPYGIAHSSENEPFELTKYALVNADFEAKADNGTYPPGWTVTPGMGQNLGQQNAAYTNGDVDPSVTISKFIEAWYPTSTGALHDGTICQQITGLPAGRYRIAADVMAVWQGTELDEDPRGIYLYYDNGSFSIHGESLATENGKPQHFEFDFDYDGAATMEVGLMAQNANQNWMGMDNFKLFAIGPMKDLPSFTALVGAYNTAKDIDYDTQKAEYSIISDFESAISAAEPLVNGGSDDSKDQAYKDAFQVLDKARTALTESQAAYKKLAAFIEKLQADEARYTGDLKVFVGDLHDEYEGYYGEGSITTADIDAAIAAYPTQIREFVQQLFDTAVAAGGTLDTPLDISPLFDHLNFPDTNGGDQEAFANGYPADAPVWMNETSTGNFKTNYGTAEVWDARPFNIYRDFTNLPKGNYTIKTHAFYRVEANDTNYPTYTSDGYDPATEYAYLYAGVNHTPLLNVAAIADPSFTNLDAPYDCTDGNFLPNNQHSAAMIFTEAQYAALSQKCYVAASGNVLEDGGTLRAGIAGTDRLQGNHWTIWYDFELYYNGIANLDDDIQSLMTQLSNLSAAGVTANVTKQKQALAEGEAALGASFDTQTAAITKLQEAIEAINKTESLLQKLLDTKGQFESLQGGLDGLSPVDPTFDKLIQDIDNAYSSEVFESNEQIEGFINDLPVAWAKYVLSAVEMDDASQDNPIDVTPVLINADFSMAVGRGVTPPFWVADGKMGANQGYQDNNTYSNEEEGVVVSQFLEAWNSGNAALADGQVSQTIAAPLPEGYYRLSVDGYATNQGTDEVVDGVYVFVNGAGANNNVSIGAAAATPLTYTIDFSASGSGLTTVGILAQSTPANWFAVDNFKLEYLGKTAPDAIENLNTDAAATIIYGIDGRQQSQLRRGINIVRKNGKVDKVLVK